MDRADILSRFSYMKFKPLLAPANRLGLDEPLLNWFGAVTDRHEFASRVDESIRAFDGETTDGDVLVPLTHDQTPLVNALYLGLAHAFRARGYRPVVLVCDAMMPLCFRKFGQSDSESTCTLCQHDTRVWLDAFDLDPHYLSEFVSDDLRTPMGSIEEDGSHRGVDVEMFARSSTRKFLRKHRIDYSDPTESEVYDRFLSTAIQFVDATYAAHKRFDLAAIIGHHPGYLNSGVFLATGKELGVPSVCTALSTHRSSTLYFGNVRNRRPFPAFADEDDVNRRLDEPLTAPERDRIDEYVYGRRDGTSIPGFRNYVAGADEALRLADSNGTTVGLFTNLVWDASVIGAHTVFTSPFSWVMASIEALGDREDLELVIKPHPGEVARITHDRVAQWIESHVDPLPENVYLLEPDTDVDPYQLIEELDVGLVYNSTLGLEMAYDGIPVIVAADAHYRGYGFTYDPASPSAYGDLLDDAESLNMDDEMVDRARRYAHFFFFEKMIDVPYLSIFEPDETTRLLRHEDLSPGNQTIDYIVDSVLADEVTFTARDIE